MEQSPSNERCQHHANNDVFFPLFVINVLFQFDLDHHGSVGDEKDQEEDAEGCK